ncbi:MAG: hypothetical protein KFH87_06045 [Bacteroidetes bacterium]|nr:hypothetical protein [Bacteroidota bacterium]
MLDSILSTITEYPILGVLLVSLLLSLVFTLFRKLFRFAVSLAVIVIALAIVMHYLGHDTLPDEGKKVLREAEELLSN